MKLNSKPIEILALKFDSYDLGIFVDVIKTHSLNSIILVLNTKGFWVEYCPEHIKLRTTNWKPAVLPFRIFSFFYNFLFFLRVLFFFCITFRPKKCIIEDLYCAVIIAFFKKTLYFSVFTK